MTLQMEYLSDGARRGLPAVPHLASAAGRALSLCVKGELD